MEGTDITYGFTVQVKSAENLICTCGEIGIRDRFRFYFREECRFEPCQVHHDSLTNWITVGNLSLAGTAMSA